MKIHAKFSGGRLTIYFIGELDHHGAAQAAGEIDDILEEYLPRDCAVNLSELRFMDSSGIALILRVSRAMCSAVCYLLQTVGQKYTPPSAAAVIMTLESVFGTVISIIFYHERLTAAIAAGFVIIFVSIIISETKLSFIKRNAEKTGAQ